MKSYNARLVALLLAAMLPVVAIASVLVVYVARQERRTVEAETRARVVRLVDLVDREVSANLRVLEALATSPNLDGPNYRAFHDEARRVLASQPGWLTIILADLGGWQILSARQPFDRAPVRVIDLPSYEEAVRTGRAVVGRISPPSPLTGARAIPIRVPVLREGKLRYVLTAPLQPEGIGRILQESGIPAGWIGSVVDREGRIVARTRDADTRVGQAVIEPTLAAMRAGTGNGLYDGRSLEGDELVVAFGTSGLTGWSVHLGIPRAAFEAPLRRAVLTAALGGLGSILLAAALTWLVQHDVAAARRQEAALLQVQKMEAIGRMTGGVAHDFNNMLAVIRSAAGLVRRRPDDARRDFFLDSIIEATDRGAKLTRQLLSFAGRRASQAEAIDLARRIPASAELLRPSLRSDIAWQLELAPGLWPVEVDPAELELALLNLIVNACDAMPGGGVLKLTAHNMSLPQPGEALPNLEGDHVRLTVTDTGVGMPPAIIEQAFEPFFTTKDRGKGTGLGLSQVYGFARQSGGTAVIHSRPGAGTTVALYLPRTCKTPVTPVPDADGGASLPDRQLQILLVEDDPAVSATAAALLERLGHVPAAVVDRAGPALEVLDRGQRFDLVFSDVLMPGGMDGVALAREIRRRHPGLPVLLATGYALEVEQGSLPDIHVLRKPYSIAALQEAIALSVRSETRPQAAG